MATAIARIGREKRLATLAKNLYVIEGDEATELQRRAERALLRQNPCLAAADGFAAGRMRLVPPVPGLRTTAQDHRERTRPVGGPPRGVGASPVWRRPHRGGL